MYTFFFLLKAASWLFFSCSALSLQVSISCCSPTSGFPAGSVGKECACNAGDLGSIPGSGRSPGEGIDYPLQYSWASLLAQLVKNRPEIQETWVWSLGWEDPLEKGKATRSSTLAWRIPWNIKFMGSQRVRHNWAIFTFIHYLVFYPVPKGSIIKY